MVNCFSDSIIYVHAPAHIATGGVELLHQLVHTLRSSGYTAYIVFSGEAPFRIHPEYRKYNVTGVFENEVEDGCHNIEVYSEIMCRALSDNHRKTQKVLWWMSVDNYFRYKLDQICVKDIFVWNKVLGINVFLHRIKTSILNNRNDFIDKYSIRELKQLDCTFCHQCEYIRSFLSKFGEIESLPLSDYINSGLISIGNNVEKEDIVLYNPAKGLVFTERLIKLAPDLRWVPIQNLSRIDLHRLLSRAKLYVDFGNHPGKDRLPRECAMANCCVITGKRGSAGFDKDVAIPSSYKFSDNLFLRGAIIRRIRYILSNYEVCVKDFQCYREKILDEKSVFEGEVLSLFECCHNGKQ